MMTAYPEINNVCIVNFLIVISLKMRRSCRISVVLLLMSLYCVLLDVQLMTNKVRCNKFQMTFMQKFQNRKGLSIRQRTMLSQKPPQVQ